jgi:hypothetical protein
MGCDVWTDHEWSEGRVVRVDNHPTLGRYQRIEHRCERCGKVQAETRWFTPDRRVVGLGQNGYEGGQ